MEEQNRMRKEAAKAKKEEKKRLAAELAAKGGGKPDKLQAKLLQKKKTFIGAATAGPAV